MRSPNSNVLRLSRRICQLHTWYCLLEMSFLFVVVVTLTRIIKSVVTGQAPITLELRNTPGKNTHNIRWYTHISHLTQFMPPPETYKRKKSGFSLRCARSRPVHTSHYSRLEKPNMICMVGWRSTGNNRGLGTSVRRVSAGTVVE